MYKRIHTSNRKSEGKKSTWTIQTWIKRILNNMWGSK